MNYVKPRRKPNTWPKKDLPCYTTQHTIFYAFFFQDIRGTSKPSSSLAYVVPPRRDTHCNLAGSTVFPSSLRTLSRTWTFRTRPNITVVVGSLEGGRQTSLAWYSCVPNSHFLIGEHLNGKQQTSHSMHMALSRTKGGWTRCCQEGWL